MAYLRPEDNRLNRPAGAGGGGTAITGGGSMGQAPQIGSGAWTNVQRYIQPEAGMRMGQQIAGDISQQREQLGQESAEMSKVYMDQLTKDTEDETAIQKSLEGLTQRGTEITPELSGKLQSDITASEKQYQPPVYTGGAQMQQPLGDFQDRLAGTETEAGRIEELSGVYSRPETVTRGMNLLDQLLLQTSGRQPLEAQRNIGMGGLPSQISAEEVARTQAIEKLGGLRGQTQNIVTGLAEDVSGMPDVMKQQVEIDRDAWQKAMQPYYEQGDAIRAQNIKDINDLMRTTIRDDTWTSIDEKKFQDRLDSIKQGTRGALFQLDRDAPEQPVRDIEQQYPDWYAQYQALQNLVGGYQPQGV